VKGTVRIHVNGAGSGKRVSLFIHQFMASGMAGPSYTNAQGDAYIDVNTDSGADAEVYVDGQLRIGRASIKDTYYV
jgi:hypothetical protein